MCPSSSIVVVRRPEGTPGFACCSQVIIPFFILGCPIIKRKTVVFFYTPFRLEMDITMKCYSTGYLVFVTVTHKRVPTSQPVLQMPCVHDPQSLCNVISVMMMMTLFDEVLACFFFLPFSFLT